MDTKTETSTLYFTEARYHPAEGEPTEWKSICSSHDSIEEAIMCFEGLQEISKGACPSYMSQAGLSGMLSFASTRHGFALTASEGRKVEARLMRSTITTVTVIEEDAVMLEYKP